MQLRIATCSTPRVSPLHALQQLSTRSHRYEVVCFCTCSCSKEHTSAALRQAIQEFLDGKPTSKAMQDQQDGCIRSQIDHVAALEPVQGNAATIRTCEQLSVVVGVAGQATNSCRANGQLGLSPSDNVKRRTRRLGTLEGSFMNNPKRT